jgi:hypothetical protein
MWHLGMHPNATIHGAEAASRKLRNSKFSMDYAVWPLRLQEQKYWCEIWSLHIKGGA